MSDSWDAIQRGISEATNTPFQMESAEPVTGGDINRAYVLTGSDRRYFAKLNAAQLGDMFAAESKALAAIRATDSVRAPQPVCSGADEVHSWLVLEYLELTRGDSQCAAVLGEQLAQMHRSTSAAFGWERDNTIGSTAQINTPCEDWVTFYRDRRLGYQLDLARRNGARDGLLQAGERLLSELDVFFSDYQPPPSLLHGDLWGGNWGCTGPGEPVIFDPASYYGDREADLAMTELFGGFGDRFYQSYVSVWAIDPGYSTRKVLYNLYHVLNHFNLFGGGYARQAEDMVNVLLEETA